MKAAEIMSSKKNDDPQFETIAANSIGKELTVRPPVPSQQIVAEVK